MTEKLEQWEKDLKCEQLQWYADGKYEYLCKSYCHEGLHVWELKEKSLWEGGICSVQEIASTREELIKKVADKIKKMIEQNYLGC